MGLADTLQSLFSNNGGSEQKANGSPTGYESVNRNGVFNDESVNKEEYLEELRGWVASSVTAISDNVASVNIRLYRRQGNGDVEEVRDHRAINTLFQVNEFTTKYDHFWLTQSYLELTGESPWFVEKDNDGNPKNVYFLQPHRLEPEQSDSGKEIIEGYEYEIKRGEKVSLGTDEVVFLKYPNPSNPFRGIGTLQMAARTVDIDNFSQAWNRSFYKNSARPDSVLHVDSQNMSDEQKEKLKRSIKRQYQGVDKAHKTMVLFGDMEYEKAGFSMKDMDFLEQQRFSRDKILGIFRVPKAIVAQTEGVNLASSKVAERVFAKSTIRPKMERLIQQLNEFFIPMFDDSDRLFLDYDNPVPEDTEQNLEKYKNALRNGWMTINEVRADQGLPEVEGGDVIRVPENIGPAGSSSEPADETDDEPEEDQSGYSDNADEFLKVKVQSDDKDFQSDRVQGTYARNKKQYEFAEQKEEVKDQVKDMLRSVVSDDSTEVKTKSVDIDDSDLPTKKQRRQFWEKQMETFETYRDEAEKEQVELFKQQRKQVLSNFNQLKGLSTPRYKVEQASDELYNEVKLDEPEQVEESVAVFVPIVEELFRRAGGKTFDDLGVDETLDVDQENVQNLIQSQTRKMATNVTETTNEKIKNEVELGISNNEDLPTIRDRLKDVFDDAEETRANRIARTEMARYNNAATEEAFRQSGVVKGKMWVTNPNPCQYCAELAGKTTPLNATMVENGERINDRVFDYGSLPHPPLHPHCRCFLMYISE